MPRTKLGSESYDAKDFCQEIQKALMVPGESTTRAGMARTIGMPESTFRNKMADPMSFTLGELRTLVDNGLPGDAILAACGCRKKKEQSSGLNQATVNELARMLREVIKAMGDAG